MKGIKIKILLVFLFVGTINVQAQNQERFTQIENNLKKVAVANPGLNAMVDLSVNGVTIQDFIRGLATTNNLNVSIDNGLDAKVVNNFSNVTVADVFIFLCKKHDLTITFIGNIMTFSKYVKPAPPVSAYSPKPINIKYFKQGDLLSVDLSRDSLRLFAKELTKRTGKNILFSPDVANVLLSGFIQKMPFNAALDKLAFVNKLKITQTDDDFYIIEKQEKLEKSGKGTRAGRRKLLSAKQRGFELSVNADSLISLQAFEEPIEDILNAVSEELDVLYYLFEVPKGELSLKVDNVSYRELLNRLFENTDYGFKEVDGVYMIGARKSESIRLTRVYQLKYRSVDKVTDYIPNYLKANVDITSFTDQNSLILSGDDKNIVAVENFLESIDKIVPVISIEVMIMDIKNSYAVSTGLQSVIGTTPQATSGSIFPETDLTLNSGSVNSLVDAINGLGIVNLGKVTSNFYMSLQMMEQNGDLKINSTPLLSSLNGHEATMNISETRYYVEQSSNIIATQNTTTTNAIVYKPLTAEFSLTINPIVSGDGQITLQIDVIREAFTVQTAGPNSPYGTSTRNFSSFIRVKNQEMIMLGGLDEITKDDTSNGVPVLSRIPVIKWFFSNRNKRKSKSKLTIFVKPTVIY